MAWQQSQRCQLLAAGNFLQMPSMLGFHDNFERGPTWLSRPGLTNMLVVVVVLVVVVIGVIVILVVVRGPTRLSRPDVTNHGIAVSLISPMAWQQSQRCQLLAAGNFANAFYVGFS